MLILPQLSGVKIEKPQAVRLWDGVNNSNVTRLIAQTSTPSADDSILETSGTLSFWERGFSSPGTEVPLFSTLQSDLSDPRGLYIAFQSNDFIFASRAIDGGNVLNYRGINVLSHTGLWTHYLISWQLSPGSNQFRCARNGGTFVSASDTSSSSLFRRGYFTINGVYNSLSNTAKLELYDVWYHPNYYDAHDINVIRKFINADGTPVKLGSRGRRPFGFLPKLFYSGSVNRWVQNKGSLILPDLQITSPANFGKASSLPT